MIEEEAYVVCLEAEGYAWVETRRQESCHSCLAGKGCGAVTLARWMGQRAARIRALDPINSQVGDRVVVGISEQALLKGSFVVYMVPLVCMIGMAVLGDHLAAGNANEEVISLLTSLLGLGVGLTWLFHFARKSSKDSRYQPVILRRKPSS